MRLFLATLAGLLGLLAGFSIPWALFVVPAGIDDSKLFHVLGIGVWFGIYMIPASLVGFLLVGWPLERLARQIPERDTRYGVRISSWILVSLLYAIFVSMGTSKHFGASLLCSLCGAVLASTVYLIVAGDKHQRQNAPLNTS